MVDAEAAIVFTSAVFLVGYAAARLALTQSQSTLDLLFYTLLGAVIEAVGVCVLLGAMGLLGWPEVLAVEVVIAVCAYYKIPAPTPNRYRTVVWWPVVIAGAVVLSISVVVALSSPSMDADTTTYHLLNAATWLHNGNIWQLPFAIPNGQDATAPGNADIFTTWLMLPSHSDQIACLTPIVFGSLCVLATAQLARSLGAPSRRAIAIALAISVTPLVALTQSHSALVDLAGPSGIISALVLAIRARKQGGYLLWICAGLCLGFAAGSKVVAVIPSILALLIAITLADEKRWRAMALLLAGYVPLGTVWYLRNWIEAGNPLYPEAIRIGPVSLRGAPLPDATSVLGQVLTGHWAIVGNVIGLAAELVGPALVILLVAVFHARHIKTLAGRIGVLSVLIIFSYLITPYTGGGPTGHADLIATAMRFLITALFVAGSVAAAVLNPRIFRIVVAFSAIYGIAIFAAKAGDFRSDLTLTPADLAVAALVALASSGLIAIAVRASRSSYRPRVPTTVVAAAIAFCGAWTLYSRIPAQSADGVIQGLGDRVAAVGVPYPRSLLGANLSTTVLSVGDGPQGAQTKITDPHAFDVALVALNVNVLAVGWLPGDAPKGWVVVDNWVEVGKQAGAIVYRHR